jgi:hypothetical protein
VHTHRITEIEYAPAAKTRDSISGAAILPADMAWPVCECGAGMTLFLQFDIAPAFELPFVAGSHLCIFMCRNDNDAPEQFEAGALPDRYWERRRRIDGTLRFYEAVLFKPGGAEKVHPASPPLLPRQLRFERVADVGEATPELNEFKVGGRPFWYQDPVSHTCSCGAAMRFLCQVPENRLFARAAGGAQPDSPSTSGDVLFLGLGIYLLACAAQCSPFAVHPVVQN